MSNIRQILPGFLLIYALLLLIPQVILADQSNQITLSPSIMQLDLKEDKPEYELTYMNNTDSTIQLDFKAQDFNELEDGWKVNFLEQKDAQNYQYSLASWISFDRSSLTLAPHETQQLKVTIDKDRLSSGGHYGSVLAQITVPGETSNNVRVNAVLSALLFVRTNSGKEIESAEIADINLNQNWFSFPETISVKIQNTGNTHLTPYGRIDIYDPIGKLSAKGVVNEGSLLALPESVRKFDIKVQSLNAFLLPGRYKALINLHWGKNNTQISKEISFFTFGNLLPVIAGILIIFGLVLKLYISKRKSS